MPDLAGREDAEPRDAAVNTGPAPDMTKRRLIFDSLAKIIDNSQYRHSHGIGSEECGRFVSCWGAGYHGQLGRKATRGQRKYSTLPQLVDIATPVRQVVAGGLHTAAVTDSGEVWCWGDGRKGQLGIARDDFTFQFTPTLVESLAGVATVVQVACGQHHTVAVTDQGDLWSWCVASWTWSSARQRPAALLAPLANLQAVDCQLSRHSPGARAAFFLSL